MKYCINKRTLIIKQVNNIINNEIPTELTIIDNLGEGNKIDEIIEKIFKITSLKQFDGFSIDEKTHIFEQGASGIGQEIIFSITMGIVGNLATDVVKLLYKWGKNKLNKKITKSFEQNQIDINNYFDKIREILNNYYKKIKFIEFIEHKVYKKYIIIKILDDLGFYYNVKILNNGNIINIKKLDYKNK